MKRLTALASLVLSAALTAPAQAHGWGGHGGWRGGYHGGGHHNHWVGPVLGAALIGGAIYASRTPSYAAPAVVTVPVAPPPQLAYYCSTWGQYYPSVQSCPVPWQLVSY